MVVLPLLAYFDNEMITIKKHKTPCFAGGLADNAGLLLCRSQSISESSIASTASSMVRLTSTSRSSIDLALYRECAVFLNVNEINLNVLALDVHDGERLLPISRPFGI